MSSKPKPRKGPSSSTFAKMSADVMVNFASLGAIVDQLKTKLQLLDEEIKADKDAIDEYENDLKRIDMERQLVTARMHKAKEWIASFEKNIGPMTSSYDTLAADIGKLYGTAREKHQRALKVLEDEFNYHPAFRRGPTDFFAIPFRPKKA